MKHHKLERKLQLAILRLIREIVLKRPEDYIDREVELIITPIGEQTN